MRRSRWIACRGSVAPIFVVILAVASSLSCAASRSASRALDPVFSGPLSARCGDTAVSEDSSPSKISRSLSTDVVISKPGWPLPTCTSNHGSLVSKTGSPTVRGRLLAARGKSSGAGRNTELRMRGGGKKTTVKSPTVSARWPMFSAFLYFLAMSFTIPSLPRVVNNLLSGSNAVTTASATVYGLLSSFDAVFTFLTVNFHACMSDRYGRRPYLMLSALGLGLGFLITYSSTKVWMLLIAASIDGCTSCMYSMAQACIADCVADGPKLSETFGLFQGFSLGSAFMIGMPAGGVLAAKYGPKFPLLIGAGLCVLNVLVVALFMPETLQESSRREKVDLALANPLGAAWMATRNKFVTGIVATWMLFWVAHVGMQINFINYTDHKFQWGVAQSGASLALMGLLVGVFPKLIIPRLGLERTISFSLTIYVVSQLLIAVAPGVRSELRSLGTPLVIAGIVMTAAGSVVLPACLAVLSNQVGDGEKGAAQGAADTAKTVIMVLFNPIMSSIFAYFIRENAYPKQIEGASYYMGTLIAVVALVVARRTYAKFGSLDKSPEP